MQKLRFGIDLGGTKTEIIALSVQESEGIVKASDEVFRKRVATVQGDYEQTLATIVYLVRETEQQLAVDIIANDIKIGVGIPGAVSAETGLIKNANSTWLIGKDLQGDLQRLLGRTVNLANDANCFALSEAVDGAAQGAKVVFGVIIGTGCGGAIVVNGEILSGVNAIAGEWGHNPLPWMNEQDHALPCYCGLQGCNETFLSGTGFARHFFNITSKELSAQEIVALAEAGDTQARQHLQSYITWLAKGLAGVINILDPDVIVLGGGMSNIDLLYREVPKIWQQWVFSDRIDTLLVPPKFGDSSGVRGAAWL